MLTYNVDVVEGLPNGARGELIGLVEDDRRLSMLMCNMLLTFLHKIYSKHLTF